MALSSHKNKNLIEPFEDLVDQELKRKDRELRTPRQKQIAASPAKSNITVASTTSRPANKEETAPLSSEVALFFCVRLTRDTFIGNATVTVCLIET
jgi:hypothetical protein